MFRGTFTALVTPFRDGHVDLPALERLVDAQIAAEITGLVAIGTTGESPTLSGSEREDVIRCVVQRANRRSSVLAGTGTNSTASSIAATQAAEKAGVDGAL
ncbi:MAG: dihydrodipicolinate synthase family protein, partial [Verrucomicrobiota bacterium]|nr:dihydrodipicolinate synthase family protein [Verrucomicrobiota bacterium]